MEYFHTIGYYMGLYTAPIDLSFIFVAISYSKKKLRALIII